MQTEQKFYDHFKTIGDIILPTSRNTILVSDLVTDLRLSTRLLFLLIDSDENDNSLLRLSEDFYLHLDIVLNNELSGLPQALEGLAQKFESFLKKIGYLRYKNTIEWTGDLTHEGILNSTLKNLYDGKLEVKRRRAPRGTSANFLPIMLFNNVSPTNEITEFIRNDLRNAVHRSIQHQRRNLVEWSEYVLLGYLIVINDNEDFLSNIFLPEARSNKKLQIHFEKWQSRYVQTLFVEQDRNDLAGLSPQIIETDWNQESTESFVPKQGKILDILNDTKSLVILGEPGLGKTTTLQFLGYQMSLHNDHLPLYFPVKDYIGGQSLLQQIADFAGLELQIIENFQTKNNILFLIDGINEILILQDSISLKNQIKALLRDYSECPFIITSRPSAYKNDFNIPVFELQPMSNTEIIDFIEKNFSSTCTDLIVELNKHTKLKEICRNPLILYFLCVLSERSPLLIPPNKGLLIRTFIESILDRENKKNPLFHKYTFFNYLIAIGLNTRKNKRLSFDRSILVNIIDIIAAKLNPIENRIQVIDLLIDSGLLVQNGNQLSFTHEIYQEYFAAEGLLLDNSDSSHISELEFISDWEQPLILYSGLVEKPEEFIKQLSIKNPLLAIKCYESTVSDNFELKELIIQNAYLLSTDIQDIKSASDGFLALAKLDKPDLINNSLESSVNQYGTIVFRSLGQIISVLIRTIDCNYLIDLIKIVMQLNKTFLPTIIRNLQQRNPDEIIEINSDLLEILKPYIYKELDSSFLLRFMIMINVTNPEKVDIRKLKKYCLTRCKTGNTIYNENGGSIWSIIKHFRLYEDNEYINKILDTLTVNQGANHLFLKKIYDNVPELRNIIIEKCLESSNISCQCTGIFLTIKSDQENTFYDLLINLKIYQDGIRTSKIRSIRDEKDFHAKILSIYTLEQVFVKFDELESSREDFLKVKAFDVSQKDIIVKSPKLRLPAILPSTERIDEIITKGQNINVKIAFLDYNKSKIYVTQHETPIEDYYKFCSLPQIGTITNVKVVLKMQNIVHVTISNRYYGIVEGINSSLNLTKNYLQVRIVKYERGVFYLKLTNVKNQKLVVKKQTHYSKKTDKQSDFAIILSQALKK
ncbi:NACHT domain-containing protein [Flavobacterium sp. C3NV]|uniref:NACHT domain-containing protein n=1 Tax=Flavobacterium sp. C3NV TaxID=3393358 RepID=UPI00398FDBD6